MTAHKDIGTKTPPPLAGGGWGEGATPPTILAKARALRRDATPAERPLWQKLRNWAVAEAKFRRQVALGPYIVDFYCASAKLVVEVDGVSHIDAPGDATRDAWMADRGIRILRIANAEVLGNLEGLLTQVGLLVGAPPPPNPLPHGEGGSYSSAPGLAPASPSSPSHLHV